jgi:hypothetical protein
LIDGRLEKILSLIQVLGTSFDDDMEVEDLCRLMGSSERALIEALSAHPEFFGRDIKDANTYWHLVLRRTGDLSIDKDTKKELSSIERLKTPNLDEQFRRPKLAASQVESLMKSAIELHARAIAAEEEKRWWKKLLVPFLGAVLGGVLSSWLSIHHKSQQPDKPHHVSPTPTGGRLTKTIRQPPVAP